ncbi:alpha/beta-hydrolase [Neolentinus lepideus HHB14362 ss-1]|uniref:Carboxylic ester hydrolase n=1 Tax=Neolentinus lepideus HHB14362 ss-1 TaxID=1314782 RepID=A0A165US14_9AGAM|nr:alpha/beta-hydrolase [Neolentinus lepideus HHB14362 ss-1]
MLSSRSHVLLGLLLSATFSACSQTHYLPQLTSPLGPVVNLGYAAYAGNSTSPTGSVDGSVTFFGGIPYAQPPLGNLRFRAPQPLDESVKNGGHVSASDARNWGPACIQQPAAVGAGSEDCLLLNVWKPANATAGDNLPAVIYIYGGGFFAGTTQGFPLYDWVAQHPTGIIGVSMGYRLNVLGFLSGNEVQADGDVNAGLLDQRAAIEWVQRNIVQFGGNPDEITISGESAGGASVIMQITAYGGTRGVPFKRAIAQSIGYGYTANLTLQEELFRNVTLVAGCPSSGPEVMPCLRSASLGAIVAAINHVPLGRVAPVVDGPSGFMPELPSRLVGSGNFTPVEFIGGHCTNDGRTFVGGTPSEFETDEDVARLVFARWPGVNNETIQQALQLYLAPGTPGSPFSTQYERAWTMAQDIMFGCFDWYTENAMIEKGVNNVFAFRWNAPDTVLYNAAPYRGVMHTSDVYFLFDGTNPTANAGAAFTPFNSTEKLLSAQAISYWTSFASSGDPSTSRTPYSPIWTYFTNSTENYRMVLTEGTSLNVTASAMEVYPPMEIERCKFWMQANVTDQTAI